MTGLFQDFRYALRQLRKSPGFTAVAVITLALGIGANTAVFSVIDAVMLRPLPYYQPERLIEANSINSHDPEPRSLCYPDFFDWRAQNHTLEHLVSYHDQTFTLTGLERPVQVDAQIVSWDLLPALGVRPELGRGFTPDEEKAGTRVALINHALWTSQLGADPAIIGRGVHLSGGLYTVIGVMPSNFRFPVTAPRNSVWTTLAVDADQTDPHPATSNRGSHFLNVFGRLKPGATAAQADQELRSIAANLAKQYPDTNTRNDSARVRTEISALIGDARTALMVVLGAVALVLLIACGNIANLLLARMRERQREIAVRSALGAGRKRIVRQLLAESLVLGALGGLAGCGLAFVCTPAILSLIGDSVPRAADAGVDLRVLSFAILVSFAAGLIFGIIPAITASRTDLVSTLKEGGRSDITGRDWLRSSLIVGQVAVGLVLTAAAGLLITSFVTLLHTSEGFNPDRLITLRFETPDARYQKGDARPQFYRDYFEKLRALPGVESAAGVMILPMTNDGIVISFEDPEHPRPQGQFVSADLTPVTPEYFRAMQVPVLKGRDFSERDDMKSPQVMVVNQSFAQKFFPGEEVLGKKLKPGAGNGTPGGPPWREIVGVVGDIRLWGTQREMQPAMYLPAAQLPTWCCLFSVVRSSLDPPSLEASVQRIVSAMDQDIPVTQVRTMNELMYSQLSQPRFATVLLSTFAGLALVLTVVGLYGVMTYSVTRRTREIGVRMALGAERGAVLTMVLRDAAILLGAGIVLGIAAALIFAFVLQDMLYGTGTRNPAVLVLVCAVVALAGVAAAFFPARRAAQVDPMVALRYE
jgi:putative ABC transport system permease protein